MYQVKLSRCTFFSDDARVDFNFRGLQIPIINFRDFLTFGLTDPYLLGHHKGWIGTRGLIPNRYLFGYP